ncbi:hypothetical protein Bbelb_373130 [Branchiostoma belcheri]|nr:hypothetical protein Bbelb_373130 [Branchiostoma belcheri]
MRVRDEPYDPTTIVNDKDGNPITCEHRIKERWQEYFNELLNPSDQENANHGMQAPSVGAGVPTPCRHRNRTYTAVSSGAGRLPGADRPRGVLARQSQRTSGDPPTSQAAKSGVPRWCYRLAQVLRRRPQSQPGRAKVSRGICGFHLHGSGSIPGMGTTVKTERGEQFTTRNRTRVVRSVVTNANHYTKRSHDHLAWSVSGG